MTSKIDFTNFKDYWADVKPFLSDPDVIKASERGIVGYLHDWKRSKLKVNKYISLEHYLKCQKKSKYKWPANYSSGDGFAMYCDELEEQIIKKNGLDTDELFIKKYPEYKTIDHPNYGIVIDHEEYECDQEFQDRSFKFREKVLQPYLDELLENDYQTYALYGSCFWYNLTFGLTLARKLFPAYNWECISSLKHLTVVCFKQKFIFDILYFDKNKEGHGSVGALSDAYADNDGLPIMHELCQYLF